MVKMPARIALIETLLGKIEKNARTINVSIYVKFMLVNDREVFIYIESTMYVIDQKKLNNCAA